tara:strand:- start:3494 stop:3697 length:204 start_codon:yes stop_codon:yes gene_type:complete
MPSLPQRLKGETSAEFCTRIGREPRVKKSQLPKQVEEVEEVEEVATEEVKEVATEEVKEESATPKED